MIEGTVFFIEKISMHWWNGRVIQRDVSTEWEAVKSLNLKEEKGKRITNSAVIEKSRNVHWIFFKKTSFKKYCKNLLFLKLIFNDQSVNQSIDRLIKQKVPSHPIDQSIDDLLLIFIDSTNQTINQLINPVTLWVYPINQSINWLPFQNQNLVTHHRCRICPH